MASRKRNAKAKNSARGSRKPKPAPQGPASFWYRKQGGEYLYSGADIRRTVDYIRRGFSASVNEAGQIVPGVRSVYTGFDAANGYDLRHIERWDLKRLNKASAAIQQIKTLTATPFIIKKPRTKKTKKAIQNYTGQNLPRQKTYFVHDVDPTRDQIKIKNGQAIRVRTYKTGEKTIESLYRFRDYNNGRQPITEKQVSKVIDKMLADLPEKIGKSNAMYRINTIPNGNIGNAFTKDKIKDRIADFYARYGNKEGLPEIIQGLFMVGNSVSARKEQRDQDKRRAARRKFREMQFAKLRKSIKVIIKKRRKK